MTATPSRARDMLGKHHAEISEGSYPLRAYSTAEELRKHLGLDHKRP